MGGSLWLVRNRLNIFIEQIQSGVTAALRSNIHHHGLPVFQVVPQLRTVNGLFSIQILHHFLISCVLWPFKATQTRAETLSTTLTSHYVRPTGATGPRSLLLAPLSPGKQLTPWLKLEGASVMWERRPRGSWEKKAGRNITLKAAW